jgi:hypothetical protein
VVMYTVKKTSGLNYRNEPSQNSTEILGVHLVFFYFPPKLPFLPEITDQNALKWLSTRSFGGNYRNLWSISGIFGYRNFESYKNFEISTEDSEERKPGYFTKFRLKNN